MGPWALGWLFLGGVVVQQPGHTRRICICKSSKEEAARLASLSGLNVVPAASRTRLFDNDEQGEHRP